MADMQQELRRAASKGRLDLVKGILSREHHVDLMLPDAVLAAVQKGHVNVVTYLLQRGANTGFAIVAAASMGSIEMVEMLLQHGATVEDKDYEGKTPLHRASENGQLAVVKLLIARGASVEAMDLSNSTPLHVACKRGQLPAALTLLREKAKINSRDRLKNTPLHYACQNGHVALVQKLLERRANVLAENRWDMIPLHNACEQGNLEVVEILVKRPSTYLGAKFDQALFLACKEGYHEVVEILLNSGACVRNPLNPLYCACTYRRLEVVKVLIEHGASFSERAADFSTPLHVACGAGGRGRGNAEIVEVLLRHGADIFNTDICGRSPMHYTRSTDVLRLLLQYDADVNIPDRKGNTVFLYAFDTEINCALLDYGAGSGLKCRKLGCLREKTGMMCHYMFCRNNIKCDCRLTGGSCLDDSSHRNMHMVDCFEMHFIKLKTAGLPLNYNKAVDPPVERLDWSEPKRQAFTNICERELEKMKSQIIRNTEISYHDLLTRNPHDLQDQAILGNFYLKECLAEFPFYGDMINRNYLIFRKCFLRKHSLTFFGLTKPWLPIECAEQVVKHLSDWDLDVLVKLCHT